MNTNQESRVIDCIARLEYKNLMYFYVKDGKLHVQADFELGHGVQRFIRENVPEIKDWVQKEGRVL